jgi:hypothetical protein
LGYEIVQLASALHLGECNMPFVGLGVAKASVAVEAARPVASANGWIAHKIGVVDRRLLGPHSVGAAIVRYTGLGADASPCKGYQPMR